MGVCLKPGITLTSFLIVALSACQSTPASSKREAPSSNAALHGFPFPPHRIAGNLYNVGSETYNSFLITTGQGHILIDTGFDPAFISRPENASDKEKVGPHQIGERLAALGFDVRDVKIILCTHSHMDHVGGHAEMKRLTGADIMIMKGDEGRIRDGDAGESWAWEPAPVNHILEDGEKVRLGKMVLEAHRTPGHTKGATTWTFEVTQEGGQYDVVLLDSSWYWFSNDEAYPDRDTDYSYTIDLVKSLPCDILLDPHGGFYRRMQDGLAGGKRNSTGNPFVDPEGCRNFLEHKEEELGEYLKGS